jgi:carbon-monoxide dehydrogenase small subunit
MIRFMLDGAAVALDVPPARRLVEMLREDLCRTETKLGCAVGRCGACAVLLDGTAVNACLLMAWQVEGRSVTTVAGLAADPAMAPLFDALAEANAFQCGYCAPGIAVALAGALAAGEDVEVALEGHLCRCTGYASILAGARLAEARTAIAKAAE